MPKITPLEAPEGPGSRYPAPFVFTGARYSGKGQYAKKNGTPY